MLSKSVEYALKSLVLIKTSNDNINVETISEKLNSPRSFTSKILQILVKSEYINSQRGPGGGFSINNYNLTIGDVIRDIDHSFKYDRCVLGLSDCDDTNPCPLHDFYKPIKEKILNDFMTITINEMCENPNKVLKL